MLVLALDSSTPVTTAAVGEVSEENRTVLAEVVLPGAGASETLLRAAEAALSLCVKDFSDVEGIIVGVGPGTFTGIRIACATARSLSLGSGAALMRGSTLSALATSALDANIGNETNREVLAVLDAKRGEVFARRFTNDEAVGIIEQESIFCGKPEELAASVRNDRGFLVVGDGAVRYREVLSYSGFIPPDNSSLNRVSAAGHILSASLEVVAAEDIIPVYVREPDAEVRRDLNPWLGA